MAKKSSKTESNLICVNKNASRNFQLHDKYEAGIVLRGTEVKSIRTGSTHINDAYADLAGDELYIVNMHIAPYSHGNIQNHEPTRRRKLLLHRAEIRKLIGAGVEKGFTLVPTRMYWVRGRVKVQLATAKGKTKGDKRQDLKKRSAKKEIDHAVKRSRR